MIDVMVDYLKITQLVSQFVRRIPERVLEELGGDVAALDTEADIGAAIRLAFERDATLQTVGKHFGGLEADTNAL